MIQDMTHEFSGFLLLLSGGCGEVAGCRAGACPGFRYVNFLSANHQNKNIKLNKKTLVVL